MGIHPQLSSTLTAANLQTHEGDRFDIISLTSIRFTESINRYRNMM